MTPSLRIPLLLMAAACGRTSLQAEDDVPSGLEAWERRARLVIGNTGRDETLVDFPVLVHLDGSRIDYAAVRPGGVDLRFVDGDGAILSHEVEQWEVGGNSYVWLRVPTLAAGADHTVSMYYGNSAAESIADPAAVWRNGYIGVYHFADPSSALPVTSATSFGMTFGGQLLGPHARFNGTDAYMALPPGFSDFGGGVTIEAWVRPTAATLYARVTDFGNGEATDNIVFYRIMRTDQLTYEVHDPDARLVQPGVIVDGTWQHLAVSHAPDGVAGLYKNGVVVASVAGVPLPSPVTRTLNFIGRSNWVVDELFAGDMDELRVSNVPRSSAWLSAQHASMTDQMVMFEEGGPR